MADPPELDPDDAEHPVVKMLEELRPHWFCVAVVRRPWTTLFAVSIVMLGSCVAGPLIHTPTIDTEIGAFRTRGTPIANCENTRYLFHELQSSGAVTTSPPRPASIVGGSRVPDTDGRRRAETASADGPAMLFDGSSRDRDRRQLQESASFQMCQNCWQNMDTIFGAGKESQDGGNVLTAATFRAICEWEDSLMDLIDYPAHCARAGAECCSPQSLPRLLSSTLGVPCQSLSDETLQLAVALFAEPAGDLMPAGAEVVRQRFLDDTFAVDENAIPHAWLTRSLLCLDVETYDPSSSDYMKQRKAMGKAILPVYTEVLEAKAAAGLPGADRVTTHVFERQMFEQLFERQLLLDLNLAAAAMLILFLAMWLHTGSCCLSACGMLQIILSVPASYSLYSVLGFTYFPYINLIGVFVVAGVGVDDVYVFHDAFTQSFVLLPAGTSLELRLSWAFRRAATAMLVTSMTTSASFLANLVSPIPPIRVFGIFNGILILANYVFVITWFPTTVVLHHKYCAKRSCCCCAVEPAAAAIDATITVAVAGADPADEVVNQDEDEKELEEDAFGAAERVEPAATERPTGETEWRRVEHIFEHCWVDTLYRVRWVALAVLAVAVAGAVQVVASQLRLATKQIQMMRSDHPMTTYTDLIAHFPSSPHISQDGMQVLVLSGLLPADTGDPYATLDRGELIVDRDFDLARPATQQWALDLIEVVQSTPNLLVDVAHPWMGSHPLERFGEWLGFKRAAAQRCVVPEEADQDVCACADALLSHPLPPPDPHRPFIYQTLRGDIEATVHDDVWWGMSPAISLTDWGSELPHDVPHEIQWPGSEDQIRLWLESQQDIPLADYVLMRWRGTIEVEAADAGEWEFQITSDDGSMLYLDGVLLLDNDGLHGRHTVQAVAELSAGSHSITITFFEWNGGEFVQPMLRKTGVSESYWTPRPLSALNGAGYKFDLYTLGTRLDVAASILPISADAFRSCLLDPTFASSGYNQFLWYRGLSASDDPTDGIIMPWYVMTSQVGGWNYYEMSDYVTGWQQILEPGFVPTREGARIGHGAFATQYWFGVMDLQSNLASSALVAMAISLLLACSVVALATRSATTTLLATMSIFAVLSCTLATLILQGWELGILESMCVAILVGISCDFVVHLAYAYQTASRHTAVISNDSAFVRRERMRWALATMGISVLSAGGTTLVAAFALSNGQVEFFHAFGTFLMLTIGFGLLFSLVGFSATAMVVGPVSEPSGCWTSKPSRLRHQEGAGLQSGVRQAGSAVALTLDAVGDAEVTRTNASATEVEQLVPQS